MNDLVIVHLSDLHIDCNGCSYSRLLHSLLKDIKDQVALVPDERLVVVVTGDIINAGNPAAIPNAKKFFHRLKEITEKKLKAIYIIPGNHDKNRTHANSFLVPAYRQFIYNQGKTVFGQEFKENIWPIQKEVYVASGYLELLEYIYCDLFNMPEIGNVAKETYGVHILNVNDKRYCFVLLNTAWSCADDSDTRKLILGEFQIKEIAQQFHDLTDESPVELSFVLGHHPIECLYGTEQDTLFSYMISYTEMSANAYLCGHTHDRNVINWSNNRHAIHTLMTGFGWPEIPSDRVHDHYYSIYFFNLDLNSMDIYVRKTNDGSKFIPDLSIYTGNNNYATDRLVRPIHFQEAQGSITLSTAETLPPKNTYASEAFLQNSKTFFNHIHEISMDTDVTLEYHKNELYENIILPEELNVEQQTRVDSLFLHFLNNIVSLDQMSDEEEDLIKSVLKLNEQLIFDNFQSFIQKLCQKMHEELVPDVDDDQIVRFHFRYLAEKSTCMYSTLCSSFSVYDERDNSDNLPSDIKYGDLLEAAFSNKSSGCLIYSINKDICKNKLKDKWKNYITIIPKFENNVYNKKVNQTSNKQYPFITFGITTNDFKYDSLLQCMDFYSMDQFISSILQRYLNTFMINIDSFVNWIKNEDKKGAY